MKILEFYKFTIITILLTPVFYFLTSLLLGIFNGAFGLCTDECYESVWGKSILVTPYILTLSLWVISKAIRKDKKGERFYSIIIAILILMTLETLLLNYLDIQDSFIFIVASFFVAYFIGSLIYSYEKVS